MNASGEFERALREPKNEFAITSETLFILNKANSLLSEHGVADATDKDMYTLEWAHRDGGFKILLESSVLGTRTDRAAGEYTIVSLIAINQADTTKGMVTNVSFSYPATGDQGEVRLSYRQYAANKRYNGYFERDEWLASYVHNIGRTPNEGAFAWFDVGLSLMEADLRTADAQLVV